MVISNLLSPCAIRQQRGEGSEQNLDVECWAGLVCVVAEQGAVCVCQENECHGPFDFPNTHQFRVQKSTRHWALFSSDAKKVKD